jgi:hypothetical protein
MNAIFPILQELCDVKSVQDTAEELKGTGTPYPPASGIQIKGTNGQIVVNPSQVFQFPNAKGRSAGSSRHVTRERQAI